jgi:lysophospholipase L1-like esterase
MSARDTTDEVRLRVPLVGHRWCAIGAVMVVAALFTLIAPPARGKEPGLTPRAEEASAALYVALGDSVAAGPGTYVERLFPYYQSTLGVTQLSNRAVSGETSGSLRTGGQLDSALADVNAASDTRAVTIDIGGNDRFECADSWASCPYRYNLYATLSDLKAALASDPGAETFAAMAYYNPASGLGGDAPDSGESWYERQLFGTDLLVDCEITEGPHVGGTDVIYQEAGRRGALVADPYPAFKEAGQSLMADSLHPNDAGHAAIADAFRGARAVCPEAYKLPLPSPPPPPPPSNDFSFGNVKKNKHKGTANLTIEIVEGPGELDLTKTKKVKADEEAVEGEGATEEELAIKPKGKARKRLNKKGKAKVRAEVTYTPDGGEPNTQSKRIKLVRRR